MERVRLVGIARGGAQRSGAVLVQRTVVADDQGAFGRIDVVDPFDIELEDGRVLRVDAAKDVRIEPLREEKVPWGDIEDDPSFASLREKGPGPHVEVVVKRSAIRDGDRVALDGEEKDWVFEQEESATMRTAPTKKLSVVSADVLASGPDAESIVAYVVEGPPPAPPRANRRARKKKERAARAARAAKVDALRALVTPGRVVFLIAVVLFVAAARLPLSPLKLDIGCIAISFVAEAVFLTYGLALPRFVRGEKALEDNQHTLVALSVIGASVAGAVMLFAIISDARPSDPKEPSNASTLVVVSLVAWLLFLVFLLRHFTKETAALVSAIASAPPLREGFKDHTWGSANGTVRDPTPISHGGAQHAIAHTVDVRVRSGSDPNIVVEKVINHGTFFVDTDDGSFELHPKEATWASSVRQVQVEQDDRKKYAYVVPLDGSVVVAGRAARPVKNAKVARFSEGRADSLLFYATGGHKDALAEMRGLAFARTLTIAAIVGCAAVMIGWAAAVAHDLPPFNVIGGDSL